MLYLLDANVLIDANRDYYPIERVPEFWGWLQHHGAIETLKIPLEIYEEVRDGKDGLAAWIRNPGVAADLRYEREVDEELVAYAVAEGYAPDLTDDEIPKIGRDAFLLGYALRDPGSHCIVTTEVSRPKRRRANRHLPDVARDFGIDSCNTFELTRRLDFRTNWSP